MLEKLSPREREVVQLVAVECRSSKDAARVLGISFRTVESHRTNIYNKTGARNIADLARQVAGAQ
jgi:two-component system, LuxR family, response regulator FixJ